MRVLLVHNHYQRPGGEDQVFANEALLLQNHGHEVIKHTVHNEDIRSSGHLRVAANTLWSRSEYSALRKVIRRERPRIVHFHNTFPLVSPAGYYAARAEHVPVVQTLHNYRLLCPAATLFRDGHVCLDCLGSKLLWPSIAHRCYRDSRSGTAVVAGMLLLHRSLQTWTQLVDRYIALTMHCRHRFRSRLPAEKIAVKPNTVRFDPGPGLGEGEYALFLGRLSIEKGIDSLLRAWEQISCGLNLKIVGDGPLSEKVKAACSYNPQIEWLGWVSQDRTSELLGAATLLILPSIWEEGFPQVVAEAFSRGTPVMSSDIGSLAEIVTHAKTGVLFPPGDSTALAQAVDRSFRDRSALRKMRLAARSEFEAKYTPEKNYAQLMLIYDAVLEQQHCPGDVLTLPTNVRI